MMLLLTLFKPKNRVNGVENQQVQIWQSPLPPARPTPERLISLGNTEIMAFLLLPTYTQKSWLSVDFCI